MKHCYILSGAMLGIALAGNANAIEDITSPFYLPSETEVFSDTSVAYNRISWKDFSATEDLELRENILIGIGQEAAVMVNVANHFNTKSITSENYNNDLNLDYELGLFKNWRYENGVVLQAGASYFTYDPESWFGKDSKIPQNDRWYKELHGHLKLGYELEDGLTPYLGMNISGNVDNSDRNITYNTVAGVHKLEYGYSFDAALGYEFDDSEDNNVNWYMLGAGDYFIKDNMTLGAAATYRFAGDNTPEMDYGYGVEARFKILF